MPLKTAVVILNWNGRNLLEKFLPGVVNFTVNDAEIYVADNCSDDDSVDFVSKNFPGVKIIQNKINYGFAGGYNECLKHIDAEFFVLLNSDVEVTEGWVKSVISLMESDNSIAACQPKIKSYRQKELFEYAGAAGGYIDHNGYPFCRGRIFNSIEKDLSQYNDIHQVFWASGACLFVRSAVFIRVGGFDESFFAHMEEVDLCWRIQRHGFKIMFQPNSVVFHLGGGTLDKSSSNKTYLNFRNNLFMLHKNLPQERLVPVILYRLFWDGVAGIKFFFSDSPAHCLAVVRAHFSFYKNIFKRIAIRKMSIPPDKDFQVKGVYRKSLVFDYFIRKKKLFSELDKEKFI